MKTKEDIKVRCFRCDKKVDEDKLNDTDLCPACAKEEEKMLDEDRRELNPEEEC